MADIEWTVEPQEEPVEFEVIEAKLKPEVVAYVTPEYEAKTVVPPAGSVFSSVDVDAIPDPTDTLTVTANDTYDVRRIGTAIVNVPQGVFPSGTLPVTQNGVYDVTEFAGINVDVPIIFDLGILKLYLLTVTIHEDYIGVLNGAFGQIYSLVPASIKIGGVNDNGIGIVALADTPTTENQLISYGMHYNSGVRNIGRRWNNNRIVIQNAPAINSWQANLKAGTSYKIAWMIFN